MKVIIIAGGKGLRLRPLTDRLPKPMIQVKGKPILEHIINLFKKYGFTYQNPLLILFLPYVISRRRLFLILVMVVGLV